MEFCKLSDMYSNYVYHMYGGGGLSNECLSDFREVYHSVNWDTYVYVYKFLKRPEMTSKQCGNVFDSVDPENHPDNVKKAFEGTTFIKDGFTEDAFPKHPNVKLEDAVMDIIKNSIYAYYHEDEKNISEKKNQNI